MAETTKGAAKTSAQTPQTKTSAQGETTLIRGVARRSAAHWRWRASVLTIAIAITVALGGPPGPSLGPAEAHELGTTDPAGLAYHNCHEVAPFVEVDYDSAKALVPPGYTVLRTSNPSQTHPTGTAGLFLNGISCESITVGGRTVKNVIESHMSILIVPPYPNDPDNPTDRNEPCTRTSCPAEPPHPSFIAPGRHLESPGDSQLRLESYIVQWITNSPEYARWMRRGTGLGDKIRVVPGLVFEYDPQPAHVFPAVDDSYFFKAPSPAPSPFHVGCAKDEEGTDCSAVVTEPSPAIWEEGINWWADTQQGTSIIHSDFHLGPNQRFGTAEGTVTSDDSDSPMGRLFAAADDANILSQVHGQPRSRQTKRFSTSDQELLAVSGEFTDIQLTKCVRDDSNPCSAESHPPPEAKGASCNSAERNAYLQDEQAVVLDLISHYGPGNGQDLTTLDERQDLVALAEGDPESGTRYSVYDHAFVSFRGMGLAIVNAGDNGTDHEGHRRPGKPDLLLYAPKDPTADATDPYGPDLPYELAGWAYTPLTYDYRKHPSFLGECIERKDWFVHERSIHPADSWGNLAVPPPRETVHGQAPGQDPIAPTECPDDPGTLVVETCPAGIQHGRIWDIHFWRGQDGASVSILSPNPIAGIDPEVGKAFFYPDDSALAADTSG